MTGNEIVVWHGQEHPKGEHKTALGRLQIVEQSLQSVYSGQYIIDVYDERSAETAFPWQIVRDSQNVAHFSFCEEDLSNSPDDVLRFTGLLSGMRAHDGQYDEKRETGYASESASSRFIREVAIELPSAMEHVFDKEPELKVLAQSACMQLFASWPIYEESIRESVGFVPRMAELGKALWQDWVQRTFADTPYDGADLSPDVQRVYSETADIAFKARQYYPDINESLQDEHIWPYQEVRAQMADQILEAAQQLQQDDDADRNVRDMLEERTMQGSTIESLLQPEDEENSGGDPTSGLTDDDIESIRQVMDEFMVDQALTPGSGKVKVGNMSGPAQQALRDGISTGSVPLTDHTDEEERLIDFILQTLTPTLPELNTVSSMNEQGFESKSKERNGATGGEKPESKNIKRYKALYKEISPHIPALQQTLIELMWPEGDDANVEDNEVLRKMKPARFIMEQILHIPLDESSAFRVIDEDEEHIIAFSLVIDLSNSMIRGGKIAEAVKTAILVAEVLELLGFPYEIVGFNAKYFVYKSIHEPLSETVKEAIGGMEQEAESVNSGYTDMGYSLKESATSISQYYDATDRAVLLITDGWPGPIHEHAGEDYELETVLQWVFRHTDVLPFAIGVGSETDYLEEVFPWCTSGVTAKNLPKELSRALTSVVAWIMQGKPQFAAKPKK